MTSFGKRLALVFTASALICPLVAEAGTITVRVEGWGGRPVSTGKVTLLGADGRPVLIVETDLKGEAVFHNLPAGAAEFLANDSTCGSARFRANVPERRIATVEAVLEYLLICDVNPLVTLARSEVRGLTSVVTGTVTNAGPEVLSGATVRLLVKSSGAEVARTVSIGDGKFKIEGVSPGDYRIEIRHQGFGDRLLDVRVGSGQIVDLRSVRLTVKP